MAGVSGVWVGPADRGQGARGDVGIVRGRECLRRRQSPPYPGLTMEVGCLQAVILRTHHCKLVGGWVAGCNVIFTQRDSSLLIDIENLTFLKLSAFVISLAVL